MTKAEYEKSQDDLTNLDIANGQCVNSTIKQNFTFGYQGLPFGINLGSGKKGSGSLLEVSMTWVVAAAMGAAVWAL